MSSEASPSILAGPASELGWDAGSALPIIQASLGPSENDMPGDLMPSRPADVCDDCLLNHKIPSDGEYRIRSRVQRQYDWKIRWRLNSEILHDDQMLDRT